MNEVKSYISDCLVTNRDEREGAKGVYAPGPDFQGGPIFLKGLNFNAYGYINVNKIILIFDVRFKIFPI